MRRYLGSHRMLQSALEGVPCAVSGVALALAFPPWNLHVLAWVALVPMCCLVVRATNSSFILWSYLGGLVSSVTEGVPRLGLKQCFLLGSRALFEYKQWHPRNFNGLLGEPVPCQSEHLVTGGRFDVWRGLGF